MSPGNPGRQVDSCQCVRVVPDHTSAVAPGEISYEAIVGAAARVQVDCWLPARPRTVARTTRKLADPEGARPAITCLIKTWQVMDVGRANLRDERHATGAHDLIKELDQCHLCLRDIKTIVAIHFRASQIGTTGLFEALLLKQTYRLTGFRVNLLEATIDQLKRIPLNRQILSEAILSTKGPTSRRSGVDTDTVKFDVLWVLNVISRESDKILGGIIRLPGCRSGRITDETTDIRQTTVVLDVIETEFRVIQLRHVPAHSYAKLVFGVRFPISSTGCNKPLSVGLGVWQLTGQKHRATAVGYEIIRREEGSAVINANFFPIGLYERFEGDVLRHTRRHVEHFHRQQGVLQLGTWSAEGRNIDRVNGIDTPLNERAFTPGNDLLTVTKAHWHITKVPIRENVSIEKFTTGGIVFAVPAELTALTDRVNRAVLVFQFEVIPVPPTEQAANAGQNATVHGVVDEQLTVAFNNF